MIHLITDQVKNCRLMWKIGGGNIFEYLMVFFSIVTLISLIFRKADRIRYGDLYADKEGGKDSRK